MGDDKRGREKQSRDERRRADDRATATALERGGEPEPPVEPEALGGLDADLEQVEYPASGADVVATVGDHVIETPSREYRVEELVPATDEKVFDAPEAVRALVQRPTIASAMKRVTEAGATLQEPDFRWTKRKAYERTFEELRAIDPDDEDEGIRTMGDWIVGRVRDKGALPSSRDVRRQAAKVCRANGYEVRTDEWLGV